MIWLRFQLFLLTLLLVTATQAQARPAIPQPKPGPVNISDVMSREDSKQLRAVHQALQQNKTDQAWTRARKISDPDIKNLAIWMIAENKPTFFLLVNGSHLLKRPVVGPLRNRHGLRRRISF